MTKHGNLISGRWIASEWSANPDPSDIPDVVGDYAQGGVAGMIAAIDAAKAVSPARSRSGILERHAILSTAAREILNRKEEIGDLPAREEDRAKAEGIGEIVRSAQIFDSFAGEALPYVRPGVGVEITRERGRYTAEFFTTLKTAYTRAGR